MGLGVGLAGGQLDLTEKDMARVYRESRRRRVTGAVLGALGTVLAMIAGYASAHIMFYEPSTDGGTYPYVVPLALAGATGYRPRNTVIGIAAAMVTGFVLMFAVTAAAYSKDPAVIMYNVWDGR